MNGFEALADAITDLADSADDAVARGLPPKPVVQEAADRARAIAFAARMAARGRIAPDELGGMLSGEGPETMTLGRRQPEPERSGRHRGRGVGRAACRWLARAWG